MPELVISNSTVIIALSSINQLYILKELYEEIIIPREVFDELTRVQNKPGSNINEIEWIKSLSISDNKLKEYLSYNLHKGEAETIALAEENRADLVLLDDYWGRKIAELRNLKITGTMGILVKAKKECIIEKVKPLLDQLIHKGFWISDDLYISILKESEES
jgi:predicted nucleic acid-binding protein